MYFVNSDPETPTFPVAVVVGGVSTVIVVLMLTAGVVVFCKCRNGHKGNINNLQTKTNV